MFSGIWWSCWGIIASRLWKFFFELWKYLSCIVRVWIFSIFESFCQYLWNFEFFSIFESFCQFLWNFEFFLIFEFFFQFSNFFVNFHETSGFWSVRPNRDSRISQLDRSLEQDMVNYSKVLEKSRYFSNSTN